MKKRAGSLALLIFLILTGVGCSSTSEAGSALLPAGFEQAKVPDVELGGYVFVSSEPPISLPAGRFIPSEPGEAAPLPGGQSVDLKSATIAIGVSPDEFGANLEFASDRDAQAVWRLFQTKVEREDVWGKLASPEMFVVRGASPWADAVRRDLDSGRLVPLRDRDPESWNLITNLPKAPPSPPIAVGAVKLDEALFESLGEKSGIILTGISRAVAFVKVDAFGFGIYAPLPVTVPETFDEDFLRQPGYGVLFVSESSYPGFLVSFILGVVAGRTGLETIDLGETNARYRTIEGLHLIIKNRGGVVFAALAGTRSDAERLMLSAISR